MAKRTKKPNFIVTWISDENSGCRGFKELTYARRFAGLMRYSGCEIATEGFIY